MESDNKKIEPTGEATPRPFEEFEGGTSVSTAGGDNLVLEYETNQNDLNDYLKKTLTKKMTFNLILTAIILFFGFMLFFFGDAEDYFIAVFFFVVAVLLAIVSLAAIFLGASQTRKINPLLCLKTEYRLTLSDKLYFDVKGVGFDTRSEYDFGVVYGLMENKTQLLLQLSSAQVNIIPKRCLSDDQLLRFKTVMLSRLGPVKCKKIKF